MDKGHHIKTLEQLRQLISPTEKQERNLTERLYDHVDVYSHQFIKASPMVFVGTANSRGHVDVSLKGDAPGFVVVKHEKMLLFPERKGNADTRGLKNLLDNDRISLLFVIPGVKEVLRINGRAIISIEPVLLNELASLGKPARCCLKIAVLECFFHCSRAMNRSHLWNPEKWLNDEALKQIRYIQIAQRNNEDVEALIASHERFLESQGESQGAY